MRSTGHRADDRYGQRPHRSDRYRWEGGGHLAEDHEERFGRDRGESFPGNWTVISWRRWKQKLHGMGSLWGFRRGLCGEDEVADFIPNTPYKASVYPNFTLYSRFHQKQRSPL